MPTDQNELTFQSAKTAGDAAAMWWASVLRNPKLDNGSDDPLMAKIIAIGKENLPSQPMDGLEHFANLLAERLNQLLVGSAANDYSSRYGISIGVDYHPDDLLAECAEQAGLRSGMSDWPWKTHMSVKADQVSVSYGYGADAKIIWTKSS